MTPARPVLLMITVGVAGSLAMLLPTGALTQELPADLAQWQALTTDYYSQQRVALQHELLFHALPLWALVINLTAALILFSVWRRQRNVSQFNWLLGISLTGNGYFLNSLLGGLLEPLVTDVLVTAWLYCLSRLLYNYPEPPRLRLLNALPLLALLLYGVTRMLASAALPALVTGGWCLGLWLASSVQIGLRLQRPLTAKLALVAGVWLLTLLGVVDTLLLVSGASLNSHSVPGHAGEMLQLVPLGQIAGVLAALFYLVSRHSENLRQLGALNESLDQRVQAAESELEERYRMLTRDALDAAALLERKSIYESIHEDLSDKLLQLIYAARSPATADLARSALAELRDSRKLHPDQDRPVEEILGDALSEIQARCEQAGLLLHWQLDADSGPRRLDARQESALTRTLREAVSNLLKHAQASTVSIEFHEAEQVLVYSVTDNGKGISDSHRAGRGLVNMRNRMQELGGSVEISAATPQGTCISFRLPLQREAP